jgi:TonB-dependent heme/hemoglobin receptor
MVSRFRALSGFRRFTLQALGTTVLTACASHAYAQNPTITLDTIDVIGMIQSQNRGFLGTPDWVYDTPGSVNVLTREQLEQRAPRNTSDLFRDMSGVFTSVDRQNPGMTINIRGLQEQGRVNVMIDGARQNFQQSGHDAKNFVYADPELIGGVQVEKGPTSGVGGAGVIGGVVMLRTLEADDILLPGKTFGSRSRFTFGDNRFGYTTSQAFAKKEENYEFVIAASRKAAGNYKVGSQGLLTYSGPGDPVSYTNQDNWSGLTKLILRPTSDQTMKFSYVGLNNNFDTGTGQYIDSNKLFSQTATFDYSYKPNNPLIDLNARLWWAGTNNQQYRPPRYDQNGVLMYSYFDLRYGLNTFGGNLANTSRFDLPLFNVAWSYGIEYFIDRTKTGVVTDETSPNAADWFSGPAPAGMRDIASGFTEFKFKRAEWLEIIVGGRYDLYSLNGSGNFNNFCGIPPNTPCQTPFAVDKSEGRFSPKLTVAVTPITGFQIYTTYAQGFRPPQIMETLQYGRHIGGGDIFAPNPNLKPEKSQTYEFGVNFKYNNVLETNDAFRAKASVFFTSIEDYIVAGQGRYPIAGTSPFAGYTGLSYFNLVGAPTAMKGLELEASYDKGTNYIGVSYSYLDADFRGIINPFFAGPPVGNAYLPQLSNWQRDFFQLTVPPNHKVTLDGGLRFFDQKLVLGSRVSYIVPAAPFAARAARLLPTYILDDYLLLGLYASVVLNENFTVRLAVDNLLDIAYVDALGVPTYPAPGRTVTLTVQAKF